MELPEPLTLSAFQGEPIGCEDEAYETPDFTILIFGGGGDLSRKKLLPTLFHLFNQSYCSPNFSIVVAGSPRDTDTDGFRHIAEKSLREHAADEFDSEKVQSFLKHIHFQFLRFEDNDGFAKLKTLVEKVAPRNPDGAIHIVYYLSVPPVAFQTITSQLDTFGMNKGSWDAKIIIEKPFGNDLATSRELNASIQQVFEESRIYRIDHYLGKETVQNILFFRFANSIFEPLWNKNYIDHVQITASEDVGIEGRGKFYEKTGVIRDIIQNHMLQMLTLVGMEPPVSFEADRIRDEREKVRRAIVPFNRKTVISDTVVGQYAAGKIKGKDVPGYREEEFVDKNSASPTFFAGKFYINNWRWSGVPFYVRAGKRLGKRITDIHIQFKEPPYQLFGIRCQNQEPGVLSFTIQPEESITLSYCVKYPNTTKRVWPVRMQFGYQEAFNFKSLPAYARLILDCLKGDQTLFVRQDGIESEWAIIDPITKVRESMGNEGLTTYKAGSGGPSAADQLIERDGRHWITDLDEQAGKTRD